MYPRIHAERAPAKPAVIMGPTTITYAELEARSNQLVRLLAECGIGPGDTIAVWAENNPRYYEIYWAAMRSGLYLTGIN